MPVAIYSALLSKKLRVNGAHRIRNYFKSSTRKYTERWSCLIGHSPKAQTGEGSTLEWSAASEAGVYVVPPLELITFAELPAEQYDTTIAE